MNNQSSSSNQQNPSESPTTPGQKRKFSFESDKTPIKKVKSGEANM
jgi:hypothetical protein